ncbi:MAG: 16S rRNA (cytidine(1402)-2'-O)-methyltransferase [Propionibacteriaceae bacterium]|jgi:16S rRNA (cytidine1402-2'-O)-methyltransferase|nr:16S rRNA (cytidine(1402)-2'-O)-methyltransferase [Propionibacteriaceae bacterium]
MAEADAGPGQLILAGTPIGDRRDASPALLEALLSADLIAAEDTRRFRALTARLGIAPAAPVISYFEGNESARAGDLAAALAAGGTVVLVTDAGMPLVSDPGYRAVQAALAVGARVGAVPGPSAVLTALAVSGLPSDRFCFEGFLPRKPGPRAARLAELAEEQRTMVFFEAPHRLAAFLAALVEAFGSDRPGAVCRELTKRHEEVVRGPLADLATWAAGEVRGEVTVVVAGADPPLPAAAADLAAEAEALMATGVKPSAAAAEVAKRRGADRKELYAALVARRSP